MRITPSPSALFLAFVLTATAGFGSSTTQVSFDSGSFVLFSLGGVTPLTAGSPLINGDGAILQLGYYSSATVGNNFLGTWIPLTGEGSLNTGGSTDSVGGTTFNDTTIGDAVNDGGAGAGQFALSLKFDAGVSNTFNSLPGATTIPLAIRIYNGTTIASSTHFNVVSRDAWLWQTPAEPAPFPPTIAISLDQPGLEWESIAVNGQAPSTAFTTSIAVPEPSSVFLFGLGLASLISRRRLRRS